MKRLLTFVFSLSVLSLSAQTLTLKWTTEASLRVPESVLLDSKNNLLYVSSIDGTPENKDGNGFISQVALDGKIKNLKWATGLDAPKGMGLFNNNLYVADISRLVTINTATGKITQTVEIEGAKFLNDVTVDKNGNVYVSDSNTGTIHVVKGNKAEVYFQGPEIKGVNGLLSLGNELYVVDFPTGVNYKLSKDKKLTKFSATAEGADGIVPVGKDEYIVSSWHGQIDYVNSKGEAKKLLDTREQKLSSADIEYDPKTKTLFVPTFNTNTVMAYTFSK
ncbi:ATP/GTP-binding protein [Chryseolinea sp. H1M3-3]|uniref:SMP-30/gluconolactonase/LRE family protein n=1 Tax=Chryseolinea sp. H1M3-3 TaxID=3034144 RepID=UPI0023EAC2E2|nr:ATP/GTP-binding protein [Chryseolinea sp. H1M3-3]